MQRKGTGTRTWPQRACAAFLTGILVCLCGTVSQAAKSSSGMSEYDVTPSSTEYTVEINSDRAFIGSSKAVDVSGGDAVYMTYTVSEVRQDDITQSGFVATQDNQESYPYADNLGLMRYNHLEDILLREGYTYFIKFQVTAEYGYEVTAAYSNGSDEGYETDFIHTEGTVQDGMKYCGIWMTGGTAKATLTHVRIYDQKGNDLGVTENGATVIDPTMKAISGVEYSYAFSVKDQTALAISNRDWTNSDVIYMEYTVKNRTQEDSTQTGVGMTNNPTAKYPHTGTAALLKFMWVAETEDSPLAGNDVTYLVRFTKSDTGYQTTVEYEVDGKKVHARFPNEYGTYSEKFGHAYLWFDGPLTADFVNFKCYDGNGKNLGVQVNDSEIEVIHYGGLEDYSVCEGGYYCSENGQLIMLTKDRDATLLAGDTIGSGTYYVEDDTYLLTMNMDGATVPYNYYYIYMTDESGNKYVRLKDNIVTIVTGKETTKETASMETSYKVEQPEEPTLSGNTFLGWYLSDGTEYDFEQVVSESVTVYAKWRDGDGNEYLATEAQTETGKTDYTMILAIAICVLLVAASAGAGIWIVGRGKKREV